MKDLVGVTVLETLDQLPEQVAGDVLPKAPSLAHIGKQVAAPADLSHKHSVVRCVELLQQLHDVCVRCDSHYVELMENLPLSDFLVHELFVD